MEIWNPEQECIPVRRLRNLQLERLRSTVARCAERVPFYRERLKAAGLSAASISSLDDIARLPFTTGADLEEAYPHGLLAVDTDQVASAHPVWTLDGRRCLAAYTRGDLETWTEISARLLTMAGVERRSVVQVAFGQGGLAGAFGLHQGAERIGARLLPTAEGDKRRVVQLIIDLGVTHLACTPRFALEVIDAAQATDGALRRRRLKAGILGGEPWSERTRQRIESGLGVETYDHYGPPEVLPGIAAECRMRDGLHIFEDHVLAEVVDPDSHEPLPDGASGELVLTTLTLQGSPLLRYRTGVRTALTRHPCACGRTFARMERVAGLVGRALVIRGSVVLPDQIESILKESAGRVPQYQIVRDPGNVAEDLELRVEVNEALLSDAMRNLRALEGRVRDHFLRELSLTVRVRFVEPGSLPGTAKTEERIVDAT